MFDGFQPAISDSFVDFLGQMNVLRRGGRFYQEKQEKQGVVVKVKPYTHTIYDIQCLIP